MDDVFFSVIIPVYNVEDYLRECVQSVLSQDFASYEIILVDDGSTDGSGQLCDEFAKTDFRVQAVHQENQGQSAARNHGLQIASGKYILFLDSDDFYPQNFLLRQIYSASRDRDMVCFNYVRYTGRLLSPLITFPSSEDHAGEKLLLEMVRLNAFTSSPCLKAVKRSLLLEHHICFEAGRICGEDIEWNARLLLAAQSIAIAPACLYAYRVRQNSITHSFTPRHVDEFYRIIQGISSVPVSGSEILRQAYYGYAAFQYCTLLINAQLCKPKASRERLREIQQMSWLLQYDANRIVKLIHTVYKLVGFKLTSLLLLVYFKFFGK